LSRIPVHSPVTHLSGSPWPWPDGPAKPPTPPPSISSEDRKAILQRHFVTMIEREVIAGNLQRLEVEMLIDAHKKLRDKGIL
jgi:hypothetical protein